MNNTQQTPDFAALTARARTMTFDALEWSANDAWEAAQAAEELEAAGYAVAKTGGYYRDEASVYRTELIRRGSEAVR